jgi:beta-ureidopropionase / N-carbamoyl-L-amino-acid hydrolase
MSSEWRPLTIDGNRFRNDFEELSRFGRGSDSGINRIAFSPAHLEARAWFRRKIEQAGLVFRQDEAGNHSGSLSCGPPSAPVLLLGSHLDSVPNGGAFDGALGVLAGLEVLRTVKDSRIGLPFNLEVIDFTDEEGSLVSFFGSFALAGYLEPEHLANPRGGRSALEEGLKRAGLTVESILSARRDPASLAGYLELHIEQGLQLISSGKKIGVVTNISGIAFYRLTFSGRADHAGTAPMETRRDAGTGASFFILSLRELIIEKFPECFANVGSMRFEPGAFNIVPEKAVLSLEFRSPEMNQFHSLKSSIMNLAEEAAVRFDLGLEYEFLGEREPVSMSQKAQSSIQKAAEELKLEAVPLISRAGHDAQIMASICPTGMIFVPSVGGISHSAKEFTSWDDCVNGANVLLNSALLMAAYPAQNSE